MCKYICYIHDYIPKYLKTQCALILHSLRWHFLIHNDDFTADIKQKNIIRTGLNGFTAEPLLYAVKYTFHCHLMVDVVNKQPVIKILILKLLRIWYEPVEVRSDDDSDDKIICSN